MQISVAISDIHGNIDLLEEIFYQLEKKYKNIKEVIYVGDIIDRDSCTKDVLDFIIDQKKKYSVFVLLGNHELMMLNFLLKKDIESGKMWIKHGGFETIRSIFDYKSLPFSRQNAAERILKNRDLYRTLKETFDPYLKELWPNPSEQIYLVKEINKKKFLFSHSGGSTKIWEKILSGKPLEYEEKIGLVELSQKAEDIVLPKDHFLVFGHIDKKNKILAHAINLCSTSEENGVCLVINEDGSFELLKVTM